MSGRGYPRPRPLVGDASSARERREDPRGWALGDAVTQALADVVGSRRDIRRFRPDDVPRDLLDAVLRAGHAGPSVGHSQPWRFIVVRDPALRDRAAHLADVKRLEQADNLGSERAAQLLDLKLEGLREAPLGIVVACDRRTPAAGVLGRATFPDADLWSCACAIENMWLTARAHGLGMGWVTLFDPGDLAGLLALPDGVESLGWLCLGWPDERPPSPGLERAAWSRRLPLADVVMHDGWREGAAAPTSHLACAAPVAQDTANDPGGGVTPDAPAAAAVAGPTSQRLVGASDVADDLLSPPESLGVLDRVVSRVAATGGVETRTGTLVLVGADHPVTRHGISAYPASVTYDVMAANARREGLGARTALGAGLDVVVVDSGVQEPDATTAIFRPTCEESTQLRFFSPPGGASSDDLSDVSVVDACPHDERGDLVATPALSRADASALVATGRRIGRDAGKRGLVALGEVGVGNTTIAAALVCALLDVDPANIVGRGAGADSDIVARKIDVVTRALARVGAPAGPRREPLEPLEALAELGGPEIAVLVGVVIGASQAGAVVVLDGLATSVAALLAVRVEPSAQAYLVAGQRSREAAHGRVLHALGLEPLLDLRLRAGEGVGASLAASLVLQGLEVRRTAARTS